MAYIGRCPTVTLKNQNQSGPWVEYGVVTSVDANGVGRIKSHDHHDQVIFGVRGACRGVVKDGKVRFERLGQGAHTPTVGLEVAFIAGYEKSGDNMAVVELWSSKTSWEKARAEARGPEPKQVVVPIKPNSHGAKRVERSAKSGRPVLKVVPFPTEEKVATPSEQQAVS